MVRFENVNFSYFHGFSLKNINLQLSAGTYALLGSNGAGKSTLIKCLVGNFEYRGKISIEGKGRIGYLPQSVGFFNDLTVQEMLIYLYSVKGISKKVDMTEINRCIDSANLGNYRHKKIKSLSGGMLRRLGVAQAILGDPEVLVFDEPTAGLDPEERMRFKNLVYRQEKKDNKVIIISTHIVEDITGNCDRIIVLKDGTLLGVMTEDELKAAAKGKVYHIPANECLASNLYIERDLVIDGEDYIRVLTSVPIDGYVPVTPSLEDGYLCLINEI